MSPSEPINLREWTPSDGSAAQGRLFTSGRPGRATFNTKRMRIPDDVIDRWVDGLPDADVLHIVSLLGSKPDGYSEFDYYPFRSSVDDGTEPTFQEWLNERYERRFEVHEHATTDRQGVSPELAVAVRREILDLLARNCTVLVIDSAGAERTARICEKLDYKPATPRG